MFWGWELGLSPRLAGDLLTIVWSLIPGRPMLTWSLRLGTETQSSQVTEPG